MFLLMMMMMMMMVMMMMMMVMQVDTLEIALHEMMDIVDIIFLVEATKTHKGVGYCKWLLLDEYYSMFHKILFNFQHVKYPHPNISMVLLNVCPATQLSTLTCNL